MLQVPITTQLKMLVFLVDKIAFLVHPLPNVTPANLVLLPFKEQTTVSTPALLASSTKLQSTKQLVTNAILVAQPVLVL